MRKTLLTGWLNSQTSSRPPGLVTRRNSRSAVSVSATLRRPKLIVTTSKLASAKGRLMASAAVKAMSGRRRLPTRSMPSEKSAGTTSISRSAHGSLEVPVPAAMSRMRSPRLGVDGLDDGAAPQPVLPEREHVVGHVVLLGDGVEHRRDVDGLLVELGAGHAAHPSTRRGCRLESRRYAVGRPWLAALVPAVAAGLLARGRCCGSRSIAGDVHASRPRSAVTRVGAHARRAHGAPRAHGRPLLAYCPAGQRPGRPRLVGAPRRRPRRLGPGPAPSRRAGRAASATPRRGGARS